MKRIYLFVALIAGGLAALYYFIEKGVAPDMSSLGDSLSGLGDTLVQAVTGKLSADQIRTLAANAGFQDSDLETAVAIALAESSGNPGAVGDLEITSGGSVGLWQINLHYHPEYTAAQLMDPQTNADAAYAVYHQAGGSFRSWSTFETGTYLTYLPTGTGTVGA